jgi:hypothetical protein
VRRAVAHCDAQRVTFLAAAEGGVAKRDTAAWLAAEYGVRGAAEQTTFLEAYGSWLSREAARVDEWALARLDRDAARAVLRGWLAVRGALFATSAEMRDDLMRLALHAGFAPTFALDGDGGAALGWRVSIDGAVGASLALVRGETLQRQRASVGSDARTWCLDMSSAPARADGFVVVRRVVLAPRELLARLLLSIARSQCLRRRCCSARRRSARAMPWLLRRRRRRCRAIAASDGTIISIPTSRRSRGRPRRTR